MLSRQASSEPLQRGRPQSGAEGPGSYSGPLTERSDPAAALADAMSDAEHSYPGETKERRSDVAANDGPPIGSFCSAAPMSAALLGTRKERSVNGLRKLWTIRESDIVVLTHSAYQPSSQLSFSSRQRA